MNFESSKEHSGDLVSSKMSMINITYVTDVRILYSKGMPLKINGTLLTAKTFSCQMENWHHY